MDERVKETAHDLGHRDDTENSDEVFKAFLDGEGNWTQIEDCGEGIAANSC
jgi:hypothetical protein